MFLRFVFAVAGVDVFHQIFDVLSPESDLLAVFLELDAGVDYFMIVFFVIFFFFGVISGENEQEEEDSKPGDPPDEDFGDLDQRVNFIDVGDSFDHQDSEEEDKDADQVLSLENVPDGVSREDNFPAGLGVPNRPSVQKGERHTVKEANCKDGQD